MSFRPHIDPLPSSESNSEQSGAQNHRLRLLNLEDREKVYEQLMEFARVLKSRHKVKNICLYGSFATEDFHEGSGIDLIIVSEFEGRMPDRIGKIPDSISLPIEPLVYTEAEFEQMKERAFLQ